MRPTLMLKLTKLHLRSIKGNYVRFQKVSLPDGQPEEVTVFSGDKCLLLGQYTPLGTIAIHESVLKNKPMLDYVIAHETAHKNQWWKLFLIPIVFLVVSLAPNYLSRSLASIWEMMINRSWNYLVDFPAGILVAASLIAIPCGFSWLLELDADFQSIRAIGFQKFVDLKNNELKPLKITFNFRFFIDLMTHPPTCVTIHIWKWMQKYHYKFFSKEE